MSNAAVSRYAESAGPLHYLEWQGQPGTTIVCVHGIGSSSELWGPVVPHISAVGRILAPDLPGHGRSPRSGRGLSIADVRRTFANFLDQVAADPVILVGTSFGGAICAAQAGCAPGKVRGLVLSSSYLPPVLGGWKATVIAPSLIADQTTRAARKTLERLMLNDPHAPPVASSGEDSASARDRPDVPRAGSERLLSKVEGILSLAGLSAVPGGARRLFDRIRCPVLVLHGEDDPLVPVRWAQHATAGRRDWTLHTFPAVTHVAKLANPELWAGLVTDWVQAVVGDSDV